jgi:hypothetical protein
MKTRFVSRRQFPIVYAPGLMGDSQFERLAQQPANNNGDMMPGTYARAVQNAAGMLMADFYLARYQTPEDRFPLLSQMGDRVATAYLDALRGYDGDRAPVLIGSSVGAGVVIEALKHIWQTAVNAAQIIEMGGPQVRRVRMPYVILLEPVYDPLAAVPLQAADYGDSEWFKKIANGRLVNDEEFYGLRVEPSAVDREPGVFHVQGRHMHDPAATRIMTSPDDQKYYQSNIGPHLPGLVVITTEGHRLSPKSLIKPFAQAIGAQVQEEVWDRAKIGSEIDYMEKFTHDHLLSLGY